MTTDRDASADAQWQEAWLDFTRLGGAVGFQLPPRPGQPPGGADTEASLLEALAACATEDGPRLAAALPGRQHWAPLLQQRWWAGAGAFLGARARALGIDLELSEHDRMQLAAEEHLCRRTHAHGLQHVPRLVHRLLDAGLHPVLLKGLVFARWLHPEPPLRPMGDADVLLPPSELTAARELLLRDGFTDAPLPAQRAGELHRHLAPLVRRVDGLPLVVELHGALAGRRAASRLAAEALVARARPFALGPARIPALHEDDRLAHLCLHHPGELSARRALDLALAAERCGPAGFLRARRMLDAEDRWQLDLLAGVAAHWLHRPALENAVPLLRGQLLRYSCAPGWGVSHLLAESRQQEFQTVAGLIRQPGAAALDRTTQLLQASLPVLLREPRRRLTAAARLARFLLLRSRR